MQSERQRLGPVKTGAIQMKAQLTEGQSPFAGAAYHACESEAN